MRYTLTLLALVVALATGVGYGTTAALGPTETSAPGAQLGYVEQPEPVAYDSSRYSLPVAP